MNVTPSTTRMLVLGQTAEAVYLRLPRELQRPTGGCDCRHCRTNPALAMWDTLVVPTTGGRHEHSYTVHMPEGSVRETFEYFARQEARRQTSQADVLRALKASLRETA